MIQLNFRKSDEFANITRFSKLEIVISIYKKALDIVPDSCSVYYKLAQTLEAQSKWEEAIEVYRKILEINPAFVPAVNQLKILFNIVVQPNLITEIKRIIPNQFLTYKKQRNYYSGRTSSSPNKYLFIHIPKTAGSLINGLIGQLFLPEECLFFVGNEGFYVSYQRYVETNQLKKIRFFSGHMGYGLSHLIDADYKITFLRNPVDRVLSNYFFWRKYYINRNPTIEDFNGNPCLLIDYKLSWEEDLLRHLAAPTASSLSFINLQTWQLTFDTLNRPHEIGSDREVLSMAKQHLDDFNFVGIYERLNSDLARLFQEQGWKLPEQL
jgi:tetratricopeptide (TPR) repeat protein